MLMTDSHQSELIGVWPGPANGLVGYECTFAGIISRRVSNNTPWLLEAGEADQQAVL